MDFSIVPDGTGTLDVDGAEIAYATWGDDVRTPALLVHGAGAQMGWWDAVVGGLPGRRLIAFDLSGNGDSGRRADYAGDQWAREAIALIERLAQRPVVLVGHSLGGRISLLATALAPDLVLETVLVDAPVRRPGGPGPRLPTRPPRNFSSLEEALQSFHVRPNEPVLDLALLRRVATYSYRYDEAGWRLKADPNVYGRIDDELLARCLGQIEGPITQVYGERSAVVDRDGLDFLIEAHPGPTELVAVPGGFHHLTFDFATEVCAAIANVLIRHDGG